MITDNTAKWKVVKLTEFAGKSLPVGFMHFSLEKEVPAGELPAYGYLYNRILYADLWAYAQTHNLVISESEWQAIASANDGNCAYYSDGDGSTTFRVPSIKCWVKGANGTSEVGSYLEAGLPNITGNASANIQNAVGTLGYQVSGAFKKGTISGAKHSNNYEVEGLGFDASKSNPIYGNSDTVQPPSLVGQWLIVAFGVAHNVGEADVANVMQAVEQVQTGLGVVDGIADYIIETYRSGTQWYEVYKSGKVRQGGKVTCNSTTITVTLLKSYANTNYTIMGSLAGDSELYVNDAGHTFQPYSKTQFKIRTWYDTKVSWVAEGQGA